MVQIQRVLFVADLEAFVLVIAQTVHGGDAVAGVKPKLAQHIAAIIVAGFQAEHVAHVAVGVDQAWDQRLARDVDALGALGHWCAGGGADGDDAAVSGNEHRVLDGRCPRAVDDACPHEGEGSRCRSGGRTCAGQQNGEEGLAECVGHRESPDGCSCCEGLE